jgi:hypothetical protein
MKPSQIRDELLSQHGDLRARLRAVQLAFERWARGEVSRSHVREELAELADELRAHDVREERALADLIRTLDVRGMAGERIMDEGHVREHRDLLAALGGIGRTEDAHEGGRRLETFCRRVLGHMNQEERAFLNASVLGDEAEPPEALDR